MRFTKLAAIAATFAATALSAHDFKIADLVVEHPYSFETAPTARSGAGYLTVTNTGTEPDRLIGVEADFPRVMIHKTEVDANGVASMTHQEGGIGIAPGETLVLEPGSYHIMFMGLTDDPLEEGESFPGTLIFEKAGRLDVVFNVEARDGHGGMDHSAHSGG